MREKEEPESLGDVEGNYASPLIHCSEGFITNSLFNVKSEFSRIQGEKNICDIGAGSLV